LQKRWQQSIDCGGNYFEGDSKHYLWAWILFFYRLSLRSLRTKDVANFTTCTVSRFGNSDSIEINSHIVIAGHHCRFTVDCHSFKNVSDWARDNKDYD
jgi:hypothetical protein